MQGLVWRAPLSLKSSFQSFNQNIQNIVTRGQNTSKNIDGFACISIWENSVVPEAVKSSGSEKNVCRFNQIEKNVTVMYLYSFVPISSYPLLVQFYQVTLKFLSN